MERSLEDQHVGKLPLLVIIKRKTTFTYSLQDTVQSISNFIYVETEANRSNGNEDKASKEGEVDLEGQLMALGERWTVLCTWVEEKAQILRITRDELELLESEKERLTGWLDKREGVLREMDRNPSDSREDLLRQGQLIAVSLFNLPNLELVVPARSGVRQVPKNDGHRVAVRY